MTACILKTPSSVKGTFHLPPSKSIYNRLLVIRALSETGFQISPSPLASDSVLLENIFQSRSNLIDAQDAGTAFRFLTAYLSQIEGEWLLTGTERMKQRPIGILVDALRSLGVQINYSEKENFPPLKINGRKLSGGKIKLDASVSSQFISALLLIAPTLSGGLTLELEGKIFSRSYIEMTLKLMKSSGINYEWNENEIRVDEQKYISGDAEVELDWSAASYWYEIAALSEDAEIILKGLNKNSLQGDSVIAEIMKQFGVETEFEKDGIRIFRNKKTILPEKFSYDFSSCPDLVQTLAATCAALKVKAEFTGVQNLRIKETDRLIALQSELMKLGVATEIRNSKFEIRNFESQTSNLRLETYNDHRMAMSLAPLALKFGQLEIENSEVVKKSYPAFWEDLLRAGFKISF